MQQLPQSARQSKSEAAETADRIGELCELSHRAPWSISVGAPAGDGELRELPRAAWNE